MNKMLFWIPDSPSCPGVDTAPEISQQHDSKDQHSPAENPSKDVISYSNQN